MPDRLADVAERLYPGDPAPDGVMLKPGVAESGFLSALGQGVLPVVRLGALVVRVIDRPLSGSSRFIPLNTHLRRRGRTGGDARDFKYGLESSRACLFKQDDLNRAF